MPVITVSQKNDGSTVTVPYTYELIVMGTNNNVGIVTDAVSLVDDLIIELLLPFLLKSNTSEIRGLSPSPADIVTFGET